MTRLRSMASGLAVALTLVVPGVAAADSGGVLPWTIWAAALACSVALVLGLAAQDWTGNLADPRAMAPALALLVLAGFGLLQTLPLPIAVASTIAPGSLGVYLNWLTPMQQIPSDAAVLAGLRPKISVDTDLSRSASLLTLIMAGFALLGALLFRSRAATQALLLAAAASGALHAVLGIFQVLFQPDTTVWGIRPPVGLAYFGAYVNRSNAAVMLHVGLAGSLGLIAWRLAALTGATFNAVRFPFQQLMDIGFDRTTMFAVLTATLCGTGLLVCGSRSGLVGMVGGTLLTLVSAHSLVRLKGLVLTLAGVGLIVAMALANTDLTAASLQRASTTLERSAASGELADGRFSHWPDSLRAWKHQPLVGWGWGAYRYGYLPFQRTGSSSWFINADNLWLEVAVETGLVGCLILAAALLLIVAALRRLDRSVAPLDHGLAITGWFLLGSLAVSQFFDFGLRVPGNSFIVATLFGAMVAAGYAPGQGERRRLLSSGPLLCRVLVGAGTLGCLAATFGYHHRAHGDYLLRSARLLNQRGIGDANDEQLARSLLAKASKAGRDDARLLVELADLEFAQQRYLAIERLLQQAGELSVEVIEALGPRQLRQRWWHELQGLDQPEVPDVPGLDQRRAELTAAAAAARRRVVAALAASPLSPEARLMLAMYDFAGGSPSQSTAWLRQAASLRRRTPSVLLQVGDFAAAIGQDQVAGDCWARQLRLSPAAMRQILQRVEATALLRPSDVVPDDPAALMAATELQLKSSDPDERLLRRALAVLPQSLPRDQAARVRQLGVIARVQVKLQLPAEAAATLANATVVAPRDAEIRYQHAAVLLQAGQLAEAREVAWAGRRMAPEDTRFQRVIETISEQLHAPSTSY